MTRRTATCLIATALVARAVVPWGPARADDLGAEIAAACASCHRPDGLGSGIPVIAGLPEASIGGAMLAYRSGTRPDQIMQVVARALSPAEIATVARYLAARKPTGGAP
jgi:cytochrome c553